MGTLGCVLLKCDPKDLSRWGHLSIQFTVHLRGSFGGSGEEDVSLGNIIYNICILGMSVSHLRLAQIRIWEREIGRVYTN